MTILITPKAPTEPTKGRQEVVAIVKAAPTGKRTLAWWQKWLADHWTP